MLHKTSILKKFRRCLKRYKAKTSGFTLFHGKEGRDRAIEFEKVLKNYENDPASDLKPIYLFFIFQKETSQLRDSIKDVLCDLFDIPLPPVERYLYSRNLEHYSAQEMRVFDQEKHLIKDLEKILRTPPEIEMLPVKVTNR